MEAVVVPNDLKKIREGIFNAPGNAYFICDLALLKTEYNGRIQQLNTREMKLDTLGVFPLPKAALPLLDTAVRYENHRLEISPLFVKSQIPIYSEPTGRYAYIPAEGANICRYFYELWLPTEEESNEDTHETVIAGFMILASYAGI